MSRVLVVPLLLLAASAAAQETPSLVLSGNVGPAFPFGDLADDGAGTGWGIGASAAVRILEPLGIFASYERTSFPVEPSPGSGAADHWTDTGVGVGAQIWLPVRAGSRLHPWVRLGVGWHDLDALIAGPEFSGLDMDGIRTLDAGGGIDIALARPALFLRPVVRYRRYSFEVRSGSTTATTRPASLMVGLGLVLVLAERDDTDPGA